MSITIKMNQDNTGIQMSGTTAGRNKTQDTKTRSTVFAGDLMLGQGNQIEQKKQTARRQAMKLITDAWGRIGFPEHKRYGTAESRLCRADAGSQRA